MFGKKWMPFFYLAEMCTIDDLLRLSLVNKYFYKEWKRLHPAYYVHRRVCEQLYKRFGITQEILQELHNNGIVVGGTCLYQIIVGRNPNLSTLHLFTVGDEKSAESLSKLLERLFEIEMSGILCTPKSHRLEIIGQLKSTQWVELRIFDSSFHTTCWKDVFISNDLIYSECFQVWCTDTQTCISNIRNVRQKTCVCYETRDVQKIISFIKHMDRFGLYCTNIKVNKYYPFCFELRVSGIVAELYIETSKYKNSWIPTANDVSDEFDEMNRPISLFPTRPLISLSHCLYLAKRRRRTEQSMYTQLNHLFGCHSDFDRLFINNEVSSY